MISCLKINRLRVMCRGNPVYDQKFHEGVNIIRGQNGSGKSTIADFIFFILGGEFDDWKDAAERCEEVQAEIETVSGKLTLRRSTDSKISPLYVYFGSLKDAEKQSLEGWQRFSLRRQNGSESFSQIMFRSLNIPEAKSDGASNITMHQLLRLAYSDQRTPVQRLFRFEPFDTQNIREAVGDLICGISGYELYESNLTLRDLEKQHTEKSSQLSSLMRVLPPDNALQTTASISANLVELETEKEQLKNEINNIDQKTDLDGASEFLKARNVAKRKISKEREKLSKAEDGIRKLELDISEIEEYQSYLDSLCDKLTYSEASFNILGSIEFTHCPACGSEVKSTHEVGECSLCHSPKNPERDRSRYNQIRQDLEIQSRESKQLLTQKKSERNAEKKKVLLLQKAHESSISEFEITYSGGNGPREAYLAEKTSRIGRVNAEIEYLTRSLTAAKETDKLAEEKSKIQIEIDKLKLRIETLQRQANIRRSIALSKISKLSVSLLHADCKRQEEFEKAKSVSLSFIDDAISVDGQMNFAESSNVFLKNSAIFAIFLAALNDNKFFHPRFLLLDNIEDKGMEVERSHLFQKLIVERSTDLEVPFQIIFTTSMMNPELELDDYVIGPFYTKENRTLKFSR